MNQTTPLADLEKMLTFYCDDLTDVLGAAEKRGAVLRSDRSLITPVPGGVGPMTRAHSPPLAVPTMPSFGVDDDLTPLPPPVNAVERPGAAVWRSVAPHAPASRSGPR